MLRQKKKRKKKKMRNVITKEMKNIHPTKSICVEGKKHPFHHSNSSITRSESSGQTDVEWKGKKKS